MYGKFTYIYHTNETNVGNYTSPMDPSWDLQKSAPPKFHKNHLRKLTWPVENPTMNEAVFPIEQWGIFQPVMLVFRDVAVGNYWFEEAPFLFGMATPQEAM